MVFTNATPARAKEIDFTQAYIEAEAGYLVPRNSSIATVSEIDKGGIRVGVMEGIHMSFDNSAGASQECLHSARAGHRDGRRDVIQRKTGQLRHEQNHPVRPVRDKIRDRSSSMVAMASSSWLSGFPRGGSWGCPSFGFIASAISEGFVKWAIGRSGSEAAR